MDFVVIDDESVLEEVLSSPEKGFPTPEQYGPLRYFDTEMRCHSTFLRAGLGRVERKKGNCNSPTHYKLWGVPTCVVHALMELNWILQYVETRPTKQDLDNGT